MELAVLLCAKAVSADTYATWVLYLWGMLSGQNVLPSLTPPEGDIGQTGLWTGCGRNFVGSDTSHSNSHRNSSIAFSRFAAEPENTETDAETEAHSQSAPAVAAADGARTARLEHFTVQQESQPLPWEELPLGPQSAERNPAADAAPSVISIGLQRDPNILSEKNFLLTAHKIPNHNRWTSAGKQLPRPRASAPRQTPAYLPSLCFTASFGLKPRLSEPSAT